ncbi:VRR-NUC domain-containing protein [Candidatus Uhrbacteria bacterium]|nr:VRR-NUC domain-containing protein [Candidatus Uhrbacteria bacterium]
MKPTIPKENGPNGITSQVRQVLRKMKIWHYKHYSGGKFGQTGVADIIGCFHGRFLAIEVKRPGRVPTKNQQKFLDNVNAAGGIAFVAYSASEVYETLSSIETEHSNAT